MDQSAVDVSILIVNYNGAKLIGPCVDSIFETVVSTRLEVIIVDNASTDQSVLAIKTLKHPVRSFFSPQNLGFAAANNLAASHANGRYLFALNNDTIVLPGAIDHLFSVIQSDPTIGILGPRLLNSDGSVQGQGSVLGHFQFRSTRRRSISFLSGAAMVIPAALYRQVGGFDENYFFYNEDIDLCKTIIKAGYQLIYDPEAAIIHLGGQATATRRRESIVEGFRGGLYLCRKHYGYVAYSAYRCLLFVWIMVGWLAAACRPTRMDYRLAYADVMRIIISGRIERELF